MAVQNDNKILVRGNIVDEIHRLFLDKKHPTDVNDYYHVFNETNILNVIYWNDLMQLVADVPGDIVECGVGRGRLWERRQRR